MKIAATDAFCYALLAITVTAVSTQDQHHEVAVGSLEKRIAKRDASLMIDHFPEPTSYRLKPKVIYRKVSRHPKIPKPIRPPRHKPRSVKKRYPVKKTRSKTRYGPPKKKIPKYSTKYSYKPPKKIPVKHVYQPEPTGFGEPPKYVEYHAPRPTDVEPTVDSYGAPVKLPPIPLSPHSYSSHFERPEFDQEYHQSWQSFQRDQHVDNSYAYANYNPSFADPDSEREITQSDPEYNLEHYSDIYKFNHEQEPASFSRKKKPLYASVNNKFSRPWKGKESEDQKIVGGPYAEPPGRFIQGYQQQSNPFRSYTRFNEEDFSPPDRFEDSDVASATISPYVNYKNSNMAFSPQNLNDAFGIVD